MPPGPLLGPLGRARFTSRARLVALPQRPRPPLPSQEHRLPLSLLQLEAAGEVEMLVGGGNVLRRQAVAAAHKVLRLEHRVQRTCAALPAALRRLLAGESCWGACTCLPAAVF